MTNTNTATSPNANTVRELFVVFLENCDDQLLRQTIRYNPEPEAVEAARQVIAYRQRQRDKATTI